MVGHFPSTRWSLILGQSASDVQRRRAADELCRLYWQPVYAFIRHSLPGEAGSGVGHDQAEDLTQGFFASALAGGLFEDADPGRGRLRSYLLGAVKNFVAAEHRKAAAAKRGGDISFVHIDARREEENRYSGAVAITDRGLPPDQWFDRRWAEGLLETGLRSLRDEYAAKGRTVMYRALKPLLAADGSDRERLQEEAREMLGCGPGALRVALHRFRNRYRELVRAEIRATLAEADTLEDEIAWLGKVLVAKE